MCATQYLLMLERWLKLASRLSDLNPRVHMVEKKIDPGLAHGCHDTLPPKKCNLIKKTKRYLLAEGA